jgi:hypothetical protein
MDGLSQKYTSFYQSTTAIVGSNLSLDADVRSVLFCVYATCIRKRIPRIDPHAWDLVKCP